jgi:serine-type D-Ala-D-Ala carboxypeptidase
VPVARRSVLLAGAALGLAGCGPERRTPAPASAPSAGPSAPAPSAPGPSPSAPPATYGPRLVQAMQRYVRPAPDHPRYPAYAGAVALAAVDGVTTVHEAVGEAVRYGPGPAELPPAQRVPMRVDSVFDIASITKVFTAILVLRQVDAGRIALDQPVSRYLPDFQGTGKAAVTVSMLLTHTAGLPDGISISGLPDAAARRAALLERPLVAGAVPGRLFRYSDANFLVLGLMLEKVTGRPLDALVHDLAASLGLRDTGFNPRGWLSPQDRSTRLVATDVKRERGAVHDGNAYAMGGVAGHAGIFTTAADLAVVGQMLLGGGEYRGTRVLAEATVRRMLVNANAGLPAVDNPEHKGWTSAYGLGVRLEQPWFMGKLSSPVTFGHTGFTGTSIVVDPRRRAVLVLLTNRAHPDWRRGNPDPARVAVADAFAEGLG